MTNKTRVSNLTRAAWP